MEDHKWEVWEVNENVSICKICKCSKSNLYVGIFWDSTNKYVVCDGINCKEEVLKSVLK